MPLLGLPLPSAVLAALLAHCSVSPGGHVLSVWQVLPSAAWAPLAPVLSLATALGYNRSQTPVYRAVLSKVSSEAYPARGTR